MKPIFGGHNCPSCSSNKTMKLTHTAITIALLDTGARAADTIKSIHQANVAATGAGRAHTTDDTSSCILKSIDMNEGTTKRREISSAKKSKSTRHTAPKAPRSKKKKACALPVALRDKMVRTTAMVCMDLLQHPQKWILALESSPVFGFLISSTKYIIDIFCLSHELPFTANTSSPRPTTENDLVLIYFCMH